MIAVAVGTEAFPADTISLGGDTKYVIAVCAVNDGTEPEG